MSAEEHRLDSTTDSRNIDSLVVSSPRTRRKSLIRMVRWLIACVVLLFLFLAIRRAYHEFQSRGEVILWSEVSIAYLVLGVVTCMTALIPTCIAWIQTLRDFQQKVPTAIAFRSYFLGHLGKYVPGKAMAVILRVGQLHAHGVLVRPAIVSVFMETLVSVAVGALIGATLVLQMSPPQWISISAWIGIPFAIASLVPYLFRSLVAFISRSRIGQMPLTVAHAINWRLMIRTCAWSTLGWLLHGTSLWIFLLAIDHDPSLVSFHAWQVCTASISLGAIAGFFSMLPGGAGVREIVAMILLHSIVSEPIALAAAVIARIGTIIGEIAMVGITSLIVSRLQSDQSEPIEDPDQPTARA